MNLRELIQIACGIANMLDFKHPHLNTPALVRNDQNKAFSLTARKFPSYQPVLMNPAPARRAANFAEGDFFDRQNKQHDELKAWINTYPKHQKTDGSDIEQIKS